MWFLGNLLGLHRLTLLGETPPNGEHVVFLHRE